MNDLAHKSHMVKYLVYLKNLTLKTHFNVSTMASLHRSYILCGVVQTMDDLTQGSIEQKLPTIFKYGSDPPGPL